MAEQKPEVIPELPFDSEGNLSLSLGSGVTKSSSPTSSEEFGDDTSKPSETSSTGPRKTDET